MAGRNRQGRKAARSSRPPGKQGFITNFSGEQEKPPVQEVKDDLLNASLMQTIPQSTAGRSPKGLTSPPTSMHATFSTVTGLAPQSGAYIAMMQAKQEREQKRQQMQRMEARLKKLRVDEERTNKHIQDALKQ